jgi:hypothetical protein
MYHDVREAVVKCGHCVVANRTSHKAQYILGRLETDEPFDVVSYDIWVPGIIEPRAKLAKTLSDKVEKIKNGAVMARHAAITGVCNLTGFAFAAFILDQIGF